MNAQDWMYLLFALLVGGGILYYIVQPAQEKVGETPLTLTLNAPSSAKLGTPFTVTLSVFPTSIDTLGKTLILSTPQEDRTFTCTLDACTLTTTFAFNEAGAYTIEGRMDGIKKSQTVNVFPSTKVCIDGTIEGTCGTPPYQCVNAQLIPNCQTCGCANAGETCVNNACTLPTLHFILTNLETNDTIYAGNETPVSLRIHNDSNREADGLYIVIIDAYDAQKKVLHSTPNQIQLTHLLPGEIKPFTMDVSFSATTQYVGARIHDQGVSFTENTALGKTNELESIHVNTDTTPPLPPTNFTYTQTANGYTLTWNASPSADVDTYVIYQENTATGGFTTYTVLARTGGTSYTLSSEDEPLAYVLRAQDIAGNESSPTDPIIVPAG